MIYIQVTRGVAPRDHVMPQGIAPTVFIMASAMKPPSAQALREGVACVTAEDFRWERGDIKSTSLLGNVMARQVSADVGATETILFREGQLTEASSSNVWIVQDGAVHGVPKSEHVLEGIRYELIRELCEAEGIRLRAAADSAQAGARRRRADDQLGQQGGAGGGAAGRPAHRQRPARARVPAPVQRLPGRQGGPSQRLIPRWPSSGSPVT